MGLVIHAYIMGRVKIFRWRLVEMRRAGRKFGHVLRLSDKRSGLGVQTIFVYCRIRDGSALEGVADGDWSGNALGDDMDALKGKVHVLNRETYQLGTSGHIGSTPISILIPFLLRVKGFWLVMLSPRLK